MNIRMIEKTSAMAVVSNATLSPSIIFGSVEAVSAKFPLRAPMACVMPTTVPKNPRIGMAQITSRVNE